MPDNLRDIYRYGVEIVKSYEDDDGNWIVEGVASTDGKDEQGEIVDPKGLITSYFLNKGFIKWEHSKTPNTFIGEPLECKVLKSGQFWIKGKLYKHSPLAKEAIEAAKTLEKSNASRRIGFSIEASVVARDPKNKKRVTKAVLRNVAMTFNPVNTDTWAELSKSLETLEVDLETTCNCGHSCGADCCQITGKECLHKTLDTGAGAAVIPESLDNKIKTQDVPPDEEDEDKLTKLKRSFLTYVKSLLEKRKRKLTKGLNTSTDSFDELGAFVEATEGLDQEEAEFLASYIAQKSINITSLVNNPIGGANGMPDELTKALDESLDMLNKSQNTTDPEVEEEEGAEEEEEVQKSFTGGLKEEEAVEKAFEVSEFLELIAEGIGDHVDGFGAVLKKSLSQQNEVIGMIAKTLTDTANVIKSLGTELAEQKELVKSLSEQVEELSQQPVGRKSVVNARELKTVQKSFGVVNGGQAPARPSKAVVVDMLVKSFEKGEISGNVVTAFETSGYLAPEVAQRIGLAQ